MLFLFNIYKTIKINYNLFYLKIKFKNNPIQAAQL